MPGYWEQCCDNQRSMGGFTWLRIGPKTYVGSNFIAAGLGWIENPHSPGSPGNVRKRPCSGEESKTCKMTCLGA